jgi:hypothetical protein
VGDAVWKGEGVQDFFELRPPRAAGSGPRAPRPAWLGPPEDSFGVIVPLRLVLARTANLAAAILGVTAYRSGFTFELAIRRRAAVEEDSLDTHRALHWLGREASPPPEVLRLGVQFADGQRATNLDNWWDYLAPQDPGQAPPPGPVLLPHNGRGGERVWDQSYWVWPLPPAGPLSFVVQWPAQGVPLTRAGVEAVGIVQAAAQDERLWPEGPTDA